MEVMTTGIDCESGIYSITNTQNGKRYIGRSVNIQKRFVTHKWLLSESRHFNVHLQRAWDIQPSDFEFEVLELCERSALNRREIYWINKYQSRTSGYNICEGGNGTTGRPCTEAAKSKISAANSGKKISDAAKAKMSAASKKRWADPDGRKKMLANRPDKTGIKLRPHTEAEKRNLSEKLKGRFVSEDHKERLRHLYSGEKSLTAKLTERDVVDIRLRFLNGERQIDILSDYPQITPQTIYDIVRGRRWLSVPNSIEELRLMQGGVAQ